MATARLTSVRLDDTKIDALAALAELYETSIAEEIRNAVDLYLQSRNADVLAQALDRKHQDMKERLARLLDVAATDGSSLGARL